ncbi:hypothetical protein ACFL5M_04910 [Candidatus Neomarinimicrobiota bacterium]
MARSLMVWMVLMCWIAYLPAQDAIRLVCSWSSDTASVGEPVVLRLDTELPKGTIPHFPELLIEDRNVSLISTHLEPMAVEYTVAFWELGRIALPGIPVKIVDTDGVEKVVATDSMSIVVASVLTGQEQDIREIKEMVPLRLRNIRSFWLRVGLMVIVMGMFTILWRTRRNQEVALSDPGKSLRPHLVVQRRLKELRSEVYDPESAGDFYLKLSQILRQYLEQRYLFRALEMTTSEIKEVLPREIDDEHTVSLLVQVLEDSDLAKFANQHLSATQWAEDLSKLVDILEYTRPTFDV